MECARHICLCSTDVWLSALKNANLWFLLGWWNPSWYEQTRSKYLHPCAWWKGYSMLMSPFWFSTKGFFSQKHVCKQVQEARCGIQMMSKASLEMHGDRWQRRCWCCLLAVVYSCHPWVGQSELELAAFLEQRFVSRACLVARFNAMSYSQHRWLERKPEQWKPTQGIYLRALWVT